MRTTLVFFFFLLLSTLAFSEDVKITKAELKFYSATWCGPCKSLHAFLDKEGFHETIPLTWRGQKFSVKVISIDITNLEDGGASLGKMNDSVPELQFWVNGKRLHVQSGVTSGMLYRDSFTGFLTDIIDGAYEGDKLVTYEDKLESKDFSTKAAFFITSGNTAERLHPGDLIAHSAWNNAVKALGYSKKTVLNLLGNSNKAEQDAVVRMNSGKQIYISAERSMTDGAFTEDNFVMALKKLDAAKPKELLVAVNGTTNKDGVFLWDTNGTLAWEMFMNALMSNAPEKATFVFDIAPLTKISWANACVYFSKQIPTSSAYAGLTFEQLGSMAFVDYVTLFLSATQTSGTDMDGDGHVSQDEAHWYAALNMQPRTIAQAPLDVVANAYYEQKNDALPASVTKAQIQALSSVASATEKQVLNKLLSFSFSKLHLKDVSFPLAQAQLEGEFRFSPFGTSGQNSYVYMAFDTLTELYLKAYTKKNAPAGSKFLSVSVEDAENASKTNILPVFLNYQSNSGQVEKLKYSEGLDAPADWLEMFRLNRNADWKPTYMQLVKRLLFKKALTTSAIAWAKKAKRSEDCGL
jgi:thiol-disulfide isomerase/thioredoxin